VDSQFAAQFTTFSTTLIGQVSKGKTLAVQVEGYDAILRPI